LPCPTEKTQCENTVIAKRSDVLTVLEDKDATRSKLIINRKNSAAMTAFALMNPSDARVRPHTAGQLQGRKPIERQTHSVPDNLGARSADSAESAGTLGSQHIATNAILNESRQRAMQSGGVDWQLATPLASPVRGALPGIAAASPMQGARSPLGVAFADRSAATRTALTAASPKAVSTTGGNTSLTGASQSRTLSAGADGDFDDELDADVFDTEDSAVRLERESHTPFGSPFGSPSGGAHSKRKESTSSAAASGVLPRRASLSLRGSLCIPASSSYADTLSRSNITPKSAMAMKLEASLDKYIYKKQAT
jgi:hypothetical protein